MKNLADTHIHLSGFDFDKNGEFLDIIAGEGTENAALLSLSYRSAVYNLLLLYWKQAYKKIDLSVFGMVHNEDFYSEIPYEVQAEALLNMGCDGIKFMYSPDTRRRLGHSISDERYDKMLTLLEERGVPMLIHVNDPDEFWIPRELSETEKARGWGYFTGGFLSKQEIYNEVFAMLDKHPKLRVTFAHFFFLSNFIDEAARVMDKYPNVCFDLTPGWEMYVGFSKNIEAWRDFFEKYADRILFGSDCNVTKLPNRMNERIYELVKTALTHDHTEFKMPCYSDKMIRGLALSDTAVMKICSENYRRFVGKTKPVNKEAVISAAKRLRADLAKRDEECFASDRENLDNLIPRLEQM